MRFRNIGVRTEESWNASALTGWGTPTLTVRGQAIHMNGFMGATAVVLKERFALSRERMEITDCNYRSIWRALPRLSLYLESIIKEARRG